MSDDSENRVRRTDVIDHVADGGHCETVRSADEDSTTERRGLLRGVAASLAASLGIGGTVSAEEGASVTEADRKRARGQYATRADAMPVARQYAQLFRKLKREGLVDSAAPEQVVPEAVGADGSADEYVSSHAREFEGRAVGVVDIVRQTDLGEMQISLIPEADDSFVILDPGQETDLTFDQFDADQRVETSTTADGTEYRPYALDSPEVVKQSDCDGCCSCYECSCYAATCCCSGSDCPGDAYTYCCDCCCNNCFPCGFYNYPCDCNCTSNGAFLDCC